MSYVIIGIKSRKQYGGDFDTIVDAHRYLNDKLERRTMARRPESTKVGLDEPMFIAKANAPIDAQLPDMRRDATLYEFERVHNWMTANRVRERIG